MVDLAIDIGIGLHRRGKTSATVSIFVILNVIKGYTINKGDRSTVHRR